MGRRKIFVIYVYDLVVFEWEDLGVYFLVFFGDYFDSGLDVKVVIYGKF